MTHKIIHAARLSPVFFAFVASAACSASPGESTGATAQGLSDDVEQWRAAIVASPTSEEGCFQASFPSLAWEKTDCVEASSRTFWHHPAVPETVGNGDDYAAQVTSGLISQTVGTFPTVTGVTSESDGREEHLLHPAQLELHERHRRLQRGLWVPVVVAVCVLVERGGRLHAVLADRHRYVPRQ